jgi:hypothetical protein
MPPADPRASILLVEECFAQGDGRFLEALRNVSQPKVLGALADRWKKDSRPWARAQIFAYLEQPLDCAGHQPLVKRLFKDAEERKDDELMGAFLVAFDTLVRRVRRKHWHWDRASRTSFEEERLGTPQDTLPNEAVRSEIDPKTGQRITFCKSGSRIRSGRLFSHRTRQYLRRRAWRYFRWLGYGKPAAFPAAIGPALLRYRDADLEKGENILDSWALLQICFYGGDVIEFHTRHHTLREGRSLSELKAAPRFPETWDTTDAARLVLNLVTQAKARLIRLWAMDLFRTLKSRASVELSVEEILGLLDHADEGVQQFGAELFDAQSGNEKLSVAMWLRLLGTRNVTALATLCAAFLRSVSGERLTLAQTLELALARPAPVARLGFQLLQTRAIPTGELPLLASLTDARCASLAEELATWALARIGVRGVYELEAISRFFDSINEVTRNAAWTWLISEETAPVDAKADAAVVHTAGYDDPVLWSRLAESPFDDLKLRLVDLLARRVDAPELSADQLAPVWCAVLLGVHRGGRQKPKAVRELAEAIVREPATAERLLPVLVVAVRSIRGPEMRAGLSAVMTLVSRRPELAVLVKARLPELEFPGVEVAA